MIMCLLVKGYCLLCLFLAYFPSLEEQLPHVETAVRKERMRTESGKHNVSTDFIFYFSLASHCASMLI